MSAASALAAALGDHAEEVCRRYLPHGRKQGRYWTAGDIRGAKGRSLFVRLTPPGVPGKWTDGATGEHGDLLDLIRIASGSDSLRAALAEARVFLAMPPIPTPDDPETYDRTEAARRLWRRCRSIDGTHAEAYLHARAIHNCRFPALRFHAALFYRDNDGVLRLPALVAAVTGADGNISGVHRTWLDPHRAAKAPVARPRKALGHVYGRSVRFGGPIAGALLIGEGIETVLSLVTALPDTIAAAALSAGSLGAFTPPPGVTRLLIARDNDPEGARAAHRLQQRCREYGVAAIVMVSERNDFNDDLIALGQHVVRRGILTPYWGLSASKIDPSGFVIFNTPCCLDRRGGGDAGCGDDCADPSGSSGEGCSDQEDRPGFEGFEEHGAQGGSG